jgi:stage II sporulation SpoAA-like protein
MIKVLDHMPDGVIGLEASGHVTADDYRDVMTPALVPALERGGARVLYVLAEHTTFTPGAAFADAKLGLGHLKGWDKIAVVSDADWLENSIKAFGWMMPGEVRVFDDDEVDEAKHWLARTEA